MKLGKRSFTKKKILTSYIRLREKHFSCCILSSAPLKPKNRKLLNKFTLKYTSEQITLITSAAKKFGLSATKSNMFRSLFLSIYRLSLLYFLLFFMFMSFKLLLLLFYLLLYASLMHFSKTVIKSDSVHRLNKIPLYLLVRYCFGIFAVKMLLI